MKPEFHINIMEIHLMVAMIDKLDPDKYATPQAKALIYKCKALMEAGREGMVDLWISGDR